MTVFLRAGFLALVLCVQPLRGQGSQPLLLHQIEQGTQVRVQIGGNWREGSLAQRLVVNLSNTVVLNSDTSVFNQIPVSMVTGLQIRQSTSRASHIGTGLLLGSVLGAAVALGAGQGIRLDPEGSKGSGVGGLGVVGGVLGGLIGGGIGALVGPRLHWKDVQLPLR